MSNPGEERDIVEKRNAADPLALLPDIEKPWGRLVVKADGEMSPKRTVRRAHVRTAFSLPDDGAPEPLRGISWRAARLVAFANGVPALRRRLRAGEGVASPPRSIR